MKFSHINTTEIHPAYRAVSLSGPARLPYKQALNQQQHQSLNPFAVCNFQDESCIESFVTVEEASITSEALSLDNTLSNSYPNVISILDDQQAGLSSPNGNSTTVDEIGTGIDQNYSPSTMPPSFDDQLKKYRTKHSHTDRMIDVHNNSGITHQKTTRKSTRKPQKHQI
jgi:hypothetical protein